MSGLCLAAGLLGAVIQVQAFTLAWMHSVEKIRWEEDWQLHGDRLHLVEARIRGSGAGMEPPAQARLVDGVWHYRPDLAPLARLRLAHSPYTAGYEICFAGSCRPLADHLPGLEAETVITLSACA